MHTTAVKGGERRGYHVCVCVLCVCVLCVCACVRVCVRVCVDEDISNIDEVLFPRQR